MKRLFAALLFTCLAWPAVAGTKVWGFYGWGPDRWSGGIDQIAEQARHIPNVVSVRLYDYTQTQQVANEIKAAHESKIVLYGYSCGANATTVTANAFYGHKHINGVLGMQPSIWCGGGTDEGLQQNIGYAQNTYAGCLQTFGFGCQQWHGAQYLMQIYRPSWHGQADTDPAYQQDVLSAINRIANPAGHCDPARHHCHAHTVILHRTPQGAVTYHVILHVPIR
jgi:hypothetical protein